jgi:membrane protease YdiL (CAAX protease family)
MTRIDRRPFADGRLRWSPGRAREFAEGLLWGLCVCLGFVGLIAALGGYSLGRVTSPPPAVLASVGLWMVAALINGLGENLAVFGYALSTLERSVGFWPAALGLTLLFTLGHAGNSGETRVGLLSIAVQALFLLLTIRRTGSLWLSVGVHAGGIFAEDCLLSVPDSGVVYTHHLTDAVFHGPTWLTGGSAGPEGSVLTFLVFSVAAILFLMIHRATGPKRGLASAAHPPSPP